MTKFVINSRFLSVEDSGVKRYAIEIIKELDKIANDMDIELLISKKDENIFNLDNIKIVKYGNLSGMLWEQINFFFYLIKKKATAINLCNTAPILKPKGITIIHDIFFVRKGYSQNIFQRIKKQNRIFLYWLSCKYANSIATVSEFSKKEIIDHYRISEKRISLVPCGWQHFLRIKTDDSAAQKYSHLKKGEYFFNLTSDRKNKNLKWVLEIAKNNPKCQFAVAGRWENICEIEFEKNRLPNVLKLGYVSDSEMKYLITNSKAFLFPSLYEGFGIPPLEAMSLGVPVIVSNATSMPEVCGDSAHYIDPFDYSVDLEKLLAEKVQAGKNTLEKYSWEKSANKLKEILENYEKHR
jgi:glycosyltransferase involved in cell wall biosynthesis